MPSSVPVSKESKSWPYGAYILADHQSTSQQILHIIADGVKRYEGKQNRGGYKVTKSCWGGNTAILNVRVGREGFSEVFKSIMD